MDYAFQHEGRNYTPNGTQGIVDAESHNAALEAAELEVWASKPEHFAAYITGTVSKFLPDSVGSESKLCVVTWRGTSLGTVLSATYSRNNFGARICHVRVRGSNGATYYGRFGSDWSQLVTLRRAKA